MAVPEGGRERRSGEGDEEEIGEGDEEEAGHGEGDDNNKSLKR